MRAAGVAAGLVRSSGKTAGWRFAADRAAWIRNETAKGTTGPLLPEATSKSIAVTRAASARANSRVLPAQAASWPDALCCSRPRDGDGKWLVSIPRPQKSSQSKMLSSVRPDR